MKPVSPHVYYDVFQQPFGLARARRWIPRLPPFAVPAAGLVTIACTIGRVTP